MKFKITSIVLLLSVTGLLAFKNGKIADDYRVDTSKSSITWVGKKVTGSHNGTINLQSGSLIVDGKNLTGGNFVINMNSIKDADGSGKLEGHLKNDDFFGAAKFPTSTFVITKVTGSGKNVKVFGNLTIKGITKPLSFPATVSMDNGVVSAMSGKIIVDRTLYDIRYGSKSFFDSIGDKAIDDNFELNVKLVANK